MMIKKLAFLLLALLPLAALSGDVGAQSGSNFTSAGQYCHVVGPPDNWLPCDAVTPLAVTNTAPLNLTITVDQSGNPNPNMFFLQPLASDNHATIRNGAGIVWKVTATNNSATTNYIRLYNASPNFNGCNSATNLIYQVAVISPGIVDSWPLGIQFTHGISICVTSGYATTDTTAATASAMSINIAYGPP